MCCVRMETMHVYSVQMIWSYHMGRSPLFWFGLCCKALVCYPISNYDDDADDEYVELLYIGGHMTGYGHETHHGRRFF